jgi:hypothetical protein
VPKHDKAASGAQTWHYGLADGPSAKEFAPTLFVHR